MTDKIEVTDAMVNVLGRELLSRGIIDDDHCESELREALETTLNVMSIEDAINDVVQYHNYVVQYEQQIGSHVALRGEKSAAQVDQAAVLRRELRNAVTAFNDAVAHLRRLVARKD